MIALQWLCADGTDDPLLTRDARTRAIQAGQSQAILDMLIGARRADNPYSDNYRREAWAYGYYWEQRDRSGVLRML